MPWPRFGPSSTVSKKSGKGPGASMVPAEARQEPPLYGLSPRNGLHTLGGWRQMSFMEPQCRALVRELTAAIASTTFAAPRRSSDRTLRFDAATRRPMSPRYSERGLEALLYGKWNVDRGDHARTDLWDGILGYQTPLFDSRNRGGWGNVDLLAVKGGDIVVVELKLGQSNEAPTRPLVESATYGVALRTVNDVLRSEANARLEAAGQLPLSEPFGIRLLILAPLDYWKRWEARGRLKPDAFAAAWAAYQALVDALGRAGFPVAFGWINGERRAERELIDPGECDLLHVGLCEGYPPKPVLA
jgi:hypothetical protein